MANNYNKTGAMPPTLKRGQAFKEFGFTGTVILSGFIIGEEYNQDLIGKKGLQVFDQMRKSDATVGAALKVVKLPILAADWAVEPASEDPEDIMVQQFVESVLFGSCETSFFDLTRQALEMLDFGFMPFELVFETVDFTPTVKTTKKNPDGTTQTIEEPGTPGTYVGLKKLGPRRPLSVYKWIDDTGNAGITQRRSDGETAYIPMEKLVIFTNEREGDNFAGVSMLRTAYKHWYMKDGLYRIDAMAHERQGLGIPKIVVPTGLADADRKRIEDILQNLRANEGAFLEVPQGFDVEMMDMKGNATRDPVPIIMHHDRQIMKSVLAQFLELGGHGASGARAVSEDHQRLFQLSLEAVAKNLKETIDKYVIERLVDLNFNVSAYPKLRYQKISSQNIMEFGTAINQLVAVAALTPDSTLEEAIRDVMNLPELPENPIFNRPLDEQTPDGGGSRNPSDEAEEEQSQNIDRKRNAGNYDDQPVKASETVLDEVRKFKEMIDKNLKLMDEQG